MVTNVWMASILMIVMTASLFMIPAYAEVTSLKTDRSSYTIGNRIYFTGTVDTGDIQKLVNIVIHNPTGRFVLISGNYSDTNYSFGIIVDTNNTNQFSTKGTYNATAFIGKESDGKVTSFDFSPDGSLVIHQPYQSISNPSVEQLIQQRIAEAKKMQGMLHGGNVTQPAIQHYQSQLNETVAMVDVAGNVAEVAAPTTLYSSKSSEQYDFKNVLYPIISLCGVGIVVAILYGRKRNWKTGKQQMKETQSLTPTVAMSEPEDDYAIMILKNRLAKGEIAIDEYKAVKEALTEP